MKRANLLHLFALSTLLLGLTACGDGAEPSPPPSMTAEELAGVWTEDVYKRQVFLHTSSV